MSAGRKHTLKLVKGELVVENIIKFIKDQNIKGGWVAGLGGLNWIELGFYELNVQDYTWQKFDELLELTNLTGNIAWQDGVPVLHAHATVSDSSFHAYGGHLKEAETGGTVELLIYAWEDEAGYVRKHDEDTGLNLLGL